jgi:hypothetical protein
LSPIATSVQPARAGVGRVDQGRRGDDSDDPDAVPMHVLVSYFLDNNGKTA